MTQPLISCDNNYNDNQLKSKVKGETFTEGGRTGTIITAACRRRRQFGNAKKRTWGNSGQSRSFFRKGVKIVSGKENEIYEET